VSIGLPFSAGGLADSFARVDVRLLALAALLQLANVLLRSRAWQNALRAAYPESKVPLVRIACAYTAGMALNGVVPARGGDAAKVGFARLVVGGSAIATIGGTLLVTAIFDAVAGVTTLAIGAATGNTAAVHRLAAHAWLLALAAPVLAALVALAVRRFGPRLAALRAGVVAGGEILRTPGRYLRSVALFQALAWAARAGVVLVLLHAFGIPAGVPLALLVLVAGGVATAVPVPAGAGVQQLAVVYLLAGQATVSQALSFSIGMQAGITLLNLALGTLAAFVLFRTVRPLHALRAGRASLAAARAAA
jgi:uncharacterized membrane protein YbhN (UPF0104 family)